MAVLPLTTALLSSPGSDVKLTSAPPPVRSNPPTAASVAPVPPAAQRQLRRRRTRRRSRLRRIDQRCRIRRPRRRRSASSSIDTRDAFSSLDASSAKTVWPAVDERMLERAFNQMTTQRFTFDSCSIDVTGARATASCRGRAQFVPKVAAGPARRDAAVDVHPAARRTRLGNRVGGLTVTGPAKGRSPGILRGRSWACSLSAILGRRMAGEQKQNFTGRHLVNLRLTGPGSEKDTRHHEIAIDGQPATYQPGDALGIHPRNNPALVDRVLAAVGARGDEPVTAADGTSVPLGQALIETYNLSTPSRKLFENLIAKGAADLAPLLDKANAEQFKHFVNGWNEAPRPRSARRLPRVPPHAG